MLGRPMARIGFLPPKNNQIRPLVKSESSNFHFQRAFERHLGTMLTKSFSLGPPGERLVRYDRRCLSESLHAAILDCNA